MPRAAMLVGGLTAARDLHEAGRRVVRPVARDDQLEGAGDREERDQRVDPVRPGESLQTAHAVKVLQGFVRRLLPG